MKKLNVYVTRKIPEPALDLLQQHCTFEINPYDGILPQSELIEKVRGRDAVLCLLTDDINEDVLKAAGPQCKIFANYAVGYNNIDVEAATRLGIMVTNTPDVLTDATADLAWALLFSVARRAVESDKYLRAGHFKGWDPLGFLGMDITGKTLGVIGTGRIGANFARKASGFDMRIIYYDIVKNQAFEEQTGASYVDKETLLRQADYISLHLPLTSQTRHFIGQAEFSIMKPNAILINTARGPVVDEAALAEALATKQIWGAGLDVYENEPLVEPRLLELDNAVLLPHIASATVETRVNMGLIAVNAILAALEGKIPPTLLNAKVLEKYPGISRKEE